MKTTFSRALGTGFFLALGGISAIAQVIVGPQLPVNPDDETDWNECTVAARVDRDNEVVVVAQRPTGIINAFSCAVSLEFGANMMWSTPANFQADPGLIVDRATSTIWLSGIAPPEGDPFLRVRVAQRAQGAVEFQPSSVAIEHTTDKPLMAIGPKPSGLPPGMRHYISHVISGDQHWSAFSDDPANPSAWTDVRVEPTFPASPPDYRGRGGMPVVLSNGRVVVVARDADGGLYNAKLPTVVFSDNGGNLWQPAGAPPVRIAEHPFAGVQAVTIGGASTAPGDTPFHIDWRACYPSIAVDRATSPNQVYVAFYARRTPDPPTGDGNADIYIARSSINPETGAITFPLFNEPPNVFLFQLKDELLGLPVPPPNSTGPDQMVPAIAVDNCGNVHVMFYDTRNPSGEEPVPGRAWVDVYYALITGFSVGSPTVAYTKRLTDTSSFLVGPDLAGFNFLGHYHHMANSKRRLYCAYITSAIDPSTQLWSRRNCFLHKISPVCFSDFNGSGSAETEDVGLFYGAYAAWDGTSDLNGDGLINGMDEELFWDGYDHMVANP